MRRFAPSALLGVILCMAAVAAPAPLAPEADSGMPKSDARTADSANWVPTLVILPFRELGKVENQAGTTVAELLTVRLSGVESLRVLEPAANIELVREVEGALMSGQPDVAPEHLGVDAAITGCVFGWRGGFLLMAKLTSLGDEAVYGAWVESGDGPELGFSRKTPAAPSLSEAIKTLGDRLGSRVEQWVAESHGARARAKTQREAKLSSLPKLADLGVTVTFAEHVASDYRLQAGIAEGEILSVCLRAGLTPGAGSSHDPASGNVVAIDGHARCDAPVYRDGKALVRATCTLKLTEPGGTFAVADAIAIRTFAANDTREAGNAALAAAGFDASIDLLRQYGEFRRRHPGGASGRVPPVGRGARVATLPSEATATTAGTPGLVNAEYASASPFDQLRQLEASETPADELVRRLPDVIRYLPDPERDIPAALCWRIAEWQASRENWPECVRWLRRMGRSWKPIPADPAVSRCVLKAALSQVQTGNEIVQLYLATLFDIARQKEIDTELLLRTARDLRGAGKPAEAADIARQLAYLGLRGRDMLAFEVACQFEAGQMDKARAAYLPLRLHDDPALPLASLLDLPARDPEWWEGYPVPISQQRQLEAKAVAEASLGAMGDVLPPDDRFGAAYRDAYARRLLPAESHLEMFLEGREAEQYRRGYCSLVGKYRLRLMHAAWVKFVSTSDEERARMAQRVAALRPDDACHDAMAPLPQWYRPVALPEAWKPTELTPAEAPDPSVADREHTVSVDVEDIGAHFDLDHERLRQYLQVMQELVLLHLADQPGIHPVARCEAEADPTVGVHPVTSAAALRRPARHAISLASLESQVCGRIVDTRTGELRGIVCTTLTNGLAEAAHVLALALVEAIDKEPDDTKPARWVSFSGVRLLNTLPNAGVMRPCSSMMSDRWAAATLQAMLLRTPGVRTRPQDLWWVVARERGIGLRDCVAWTCDATLCGEMVAARVAGRDGLRFEVFSSPRASTSPTEASAFLPGGFVEGWEAAVADALSQLVQALPSRLGIASETDTVWTAINSNSSALTAKRLVERLDAETRALQVQDWYRTHPGDYSDSDVPTGDRFPYRMYQGIHPVDNPAHLLLPNLKMVTARIQWNVEHGKVGTSRSLDCLALATAWADWRRVPRYEAERLTDAYLRLYHRHGASETIPCCPDGILARAIAESAPLFRQQQFYAALDDLAECPGMRSLVDDSVMLNALMNPRTVAPEDFADAAIRILSTSDRTPANDMAQVIDNVFRYIRGVSPDIDHTPSSIGPSPLHIKNLLDALRTYLASAKRPLPTAARNSLKTLEDSTFGRMLAGVLLPGDMDRSSSGGGTSERDRLGAPVEWPALQLLTQETPWHKYVPWVEGSRLHMVLFEGVGYTPPKYPDAEVMGFVQPPSISPPTAIADVRWFDVQDGSSGVTKGNVFEGKQGRVGEGYFRNGLLIYRGHLLEPDHAGRLRPVSSLPATLKGTPVCFVESGIVFRDGRRLALWNRTTGDVTALIHGQSPKDAASYDVNAGWIPMYIGPMPDGRTLTVLGGGRMQNDRWRLNEQWLIDTQTRKSTLLRAPREDREWDPCVAFEAGVLIIRANDLWRTWPFDAAKPMLSFASSGQFLHVATDGNRAYFLSTPSADYLLLAEEGAGTAGRWTISGPSRPIRGLQRVGGDVVLLCNPPLIIRDAFTRDLPPTGTEIRLREERFIPVERQ